MAVKNNTRIENKELPLRLAYCDTFQKRKSWVRRHLENGGQISDPAMWVAGINEPGRIIASLRRDCIDIEEFEVDIVDAAGIEHKGEKAWRLFANDKIN